MKGFTVSGLKFKAAVAARMAAEIVAATSRNKRRSGSATKGSTAAAMRACGAVATLKRTAGKRPKSALQ